MIAPARPHTKSPSSTQHAAFLHLLPTIKRHIRYAFRKVPRHSHDDVVQDAIVAAFVTYCRLIQRGRGDRVFATPLARFAVLRVRDGRRVGTRRNQRDISSPLFTRQKEFLVERIDRYGQDAEEWSILAIPASLTPIPDQVAFRIDFRQWLSSLTRRNRRIAKALAIGDTTSEAAARFQITRARVSQLRREFYQSWCEFQGEQPRPSAAIAA